MSYTRDRFRDPAAALETYSFAINHSDEEANELRRTVERTAVNAGVGYVRQQGSDSPPLFRFKGTILHQDQYTRMRAYYDACASRTVYFRDGITGTEYEVVVTAFSPLRKRTLLNPRDASIPLHFWEYTLELEIIRSV